MTRMSRHVRGFACRGRRAGLALLAVMALAACTARQAVLESRVIGLEPQLAAGELPVPVGLDAATLPARPTPPVPVRRASARDDLATLKALLGRDQARALARIEPLAWPAAGRILVGFGQRPDGGRSDGIDIGVADGTPVLAAADGIVAYAGTGIAGYGAMLLVRHAGELTTVYAHNRELLVRAGERVTRGQLVAFAGRADAAGPTRVHFQLRAAGRPVDPAPHLQPPETLMASAVAR